MEKYFLAILPPEPIMGQAEAIKLGIKEKFGVKYALKSPAHITLKMPFSYNEVKENVLIDQLKAFASSQKEFALKIGGIATFGNRVIFLNVKKNELLVKLQADLKQFCKKTLLLNDELSDRNFHPHMTLAFKDLKPSVFGEVLEYAKTQSFESEFSVKDLVLLKRVDHRWIAHFRVPFFKSD
ncbi:RNA 2',3'-cyclic phosphodiesterase [Algoriphagus mannitolivorans]|uniref:RNA 2',3'-cyclic phosphodiesterase n=1 Tax=Algoriphagus mannitolivorans TaxID=226504 RepID=UPI00047DB181|nr:RNA 2',3'-cyclic phosphodiesterase [Algoriphagus mannitolivorans]